MDESQLPKYAQQVLNTLRLEMADGRLTKGEVEFLRSAVKIKESLGILGNFVVKFAAILAALGVSWGYLGSWWKS